MSKSIGEHEADLRREAYAQQVSRREAIRSALAVPLAGVGFAAFGLNGLAGNAVLGFDTVLMGLATVLIVVFTIGALIAIGWALWRVAYNFDYETVHPEPQVESLAEREAGLLEALREAGVDLAQITSLARIGAWEALNNEYLEKSKALRAKNDANLEVQKKVLRGILLGLVLLLGAIVVNAVQRNLIAPEQPSVPWAGAYSLNLDVGCLIFCP